MMDPNLTGELPESASVVIIGAGIVGCSAAYYLAHHGWDQIVVLDQGPLFEVLGSTSHAPGLVFQLNPSKTVCQLARWSVALYSQLSLDDQPCFYPVGSLEIAATPERHEELKRKMGHAMSWGLPAEVIDREQTLLKIPLLNRDLIFSALYIPTDGIAKGSRICAALARKAVHHGVAFHAHAPVESVEVTQGSVQSVTTAGHRIRTDKVLLCAGIWGPRIGKMAGVSVPLIPVEHQYVRTAPLPELAGETREVVHPILRHQDRSMYFRQQADCYGIGSYQHEPILVNIDDLPIAEPAIRTFTPEFFRKPHEDAISLFPCLRAIDLQYKINGMFSFTPDGQSLIGESSEVHGFWIAEAVWVTHGGEVGKVVADLMSNGRTEIDLREIDCNRFHPHVANRRYIEMRAAQQYREVYDIIHPLQQLENPRPLRVSPFYARHKELRAFFFEGAGWERPQWFAANEKPAVDSPGARRTGWTARYWSPTIAVEHLNTRESAALFDLTPFTKIQVKGRDSLAFLQSLTSNQMDQPTGKITYTSMLDDNGGIQCDLTVTRLDEQQFLVVTGGPGGPHDLNWLSSHLPDDSSVYLSDVTSAFCSIGVWGPRARDLLRRVTQDDLSNQAFPYMTAKWIHLDAVPALALRISYVGELGWEVYAPAEYGLHLWDTLWSAGKTLGVIAAGGGAFDSLRLEKGYRLWGTDIHSEYNPYEAGIGFAVRLKKCEFRGRLALERVKTTGLTRKLCCLTLEDPGVVVMGKEPILDADRVLGYVTSANFGYTVRRSIAYGYLPAKYAAEGTPVDIYFFGCRHRAHVCREPLFDPANEHLKM